MYSTYIDVHVQGTQEIGARRQQAQGKTGLDSWGNPKKWTDSGAGKWTRNVKKHKGKEPTPPSPLFPRENETPRKEKQKTCPCVLPLRRRLVGTFVSLRGPSTPMLRTAVLFLLHPDPGLDTFLFLFRFYFSFFILFFFFRSWPILFTRFISVVLPHFVTLCGLPLWCLEILLFMISNVPSFVHSSNHPWLTRRRGPIDIDYAQVNKQQLMIQPQTYCTFHSLPHNDLIRGQGGHQNRRPGGNNVHIQPSDTKISPWPRPSQMPWLWSRTRLHPSHPLPRHSMHSREKVVIRAECAHQICWEIRPPAMNHECRSVRDPRRSIA